MPQATICLPTYNEHENLERMLRALEPRILGKDGLGVERGALEQLGVARELGHLEHHLAMLASADQLALTAQLEIDLGQLEPVAVGGQGSQPG